MNIKGKHLKLARYIRDNYGVTEDQAVKDGFELSMIRSLQNKNVLAHRQLVTKKLYLPYEAAKRI